MDRKGRLSLLLLAFALLIIGLIYFVPHEKGEISPISAPLENAQIASGEFKVYQLADLQLTSGQEISAANTSIINLSTASGQYLGLVRGSPETKQFSFQIGNDVITIPQGEVRKIDLNNDGVYDILIYPEEINNSQIRFSIKSIDTPITLSDRINSVWKSLLNYQTWIIFLVLLILLAYVLYHIFTAHIIPWLSVRNAKAREDPIGMMQYLIEEIGKSSDDKAKTETLIDRLNHFYEYLPEADKKKARDKIKDIERYIN